MACGNFKMGYRQGVVLPMLPWAGSVLWFLNVCQTWVPWGERQEARASALM
jgi:hypothetical protein